MPLHVDSVVDRSMRLKETLSRSATLEALHLSLTSSNAEMRVFSSVVVA